MSSWSRWFWVSWSSWWSWCVRRDRRDPGGPPGDAGRRELQPAVPSSNLQSACNSVSILQIQCRPLKSSIQSGSGSSIDLEEFLHAIFVSIASTDPGCTRPRSVDVGSGGMLLLHECFVHRWPYDTFTGCPPCFPTMYVQQVASMLRLRKDAALLSLKAQTSNVYHLHALAAPKVHNVS